ncbi:peroxidase (Non-heme peroxidase), BpoB, alpha/beta hydrolase family [Rhodococcus sp. MTM3W5.2]|nr:peroxidase (Non-heme peroxidase), BpoB, alpha/beta hydrolase family [Rhodococcus sp. MTM3W5.2]
MRGLVLVDITPKVEPEGVRRIADFMRGNPDGFASLDEVADAVAAYQPHRTRPSNIDGLRRNVRERSNGRLYWHWDPAFARPGEWATSSPPTITAGWSRRRGPSRCPRCLCTAASRTSSAPTGSRNCSG